MAAGRGFFLVGRVMCPGASGSLGLLFVASGGWKCQRDFSCIGVGIRQSSKTAVSATSIGTIIA